MSSIRGELSLRGGQSYSRTHCKFSLHAETGQQRVDFVQMQPDLSIASHWHGATAIVIVWNAPDMGQATNWFFTLYIGLIKNAGKLAPKGVKEKSRPIACIQPRNWQKVFNIPGHRPTSSTKDQMYLLRIQTYKITHDCTRYLNCFLHFSRCLGKSRSSIHIKLRIWFCWANSSFRQSFFKILELW